MSQCLPGSIVFLLYACVHAKLLQSCPTFCKPHGSSVHEILQTRMLEWVAMPSCRGSPDPGIKPTSLTSPALAGRFFITSTPGKLFFIYNILEHMKYFVKSSASNKETD